MKIAIVGCGYVGNAIAEKLEGHEIIRVRRSNPLTEPCDIIVLCVPEPASALPPCKYLLMISSISVQCGKAPKHGEAEEIVQKLPIDVCIMRCAGIFGPGREIEKRKKPVMPGTGNEVTNHIHVDDIARAFVFAIEKHLTGTFNLCNDDHPTRKALYGDVSFDPSQPVPHGCNQIADNSRIKELGFSFQHSL